ncbi:DEAD/DEAH box helicase [Brevibacterium litoralis]|uniref:DEAD/DEAH box helicase n=1 Tax=Brevibacterium litoralis TaxID=3138935 RepID=UPI0032EF9168
MSGQFPQVRTADVRALVGEQSYDRARTYVRQGRVLSLEWVPDEGALVAKVQGNDPLPYQTMVFLDPPKNGNLWTPWGSGCDCPVANRCKHAAAAALQMIEVTTGGAGGESGHGALPEDPADPTGITDLLDRARAAGAGVTTASQLAVPGSGARGGGSGTGSGQGSAVEPHRRVPDWRERLRDVTEDAALGRGETPLGIGFELVARPQRSWWDFGKPQPYTVEDFLEGVSAHLQIRPVTPSKARRNTWIKGNMTWRKFLAGPVDDTFRADHVEVLRQVAHMGTGTYNEFSDPDALPVDGHTSTLFWHLIATARAAQVPLIGMGNLANVGVAGRAEAVLDVRRTNPVSDLEVGPVVLFDGEEVEKATPISERGFFAVRGSEMKGTGFGLTGGRKSGGRSGSRTGGARSGGRSGRAVPGGSAEQPAGLELVLAPLDDSLDPMMQRLLSSREPIVVPRADEEEFLEEFFPQLRSAVPVRSTNKSIALPEYKAPELVLDARFVTEESKYGTFESLTVDWSWQYHGPERVLPIGVQPGEARDLAAEHRVLDAVRAVWAPAATRPRHDFEGIEVAEFTDKVLPALEGVPGLIVRVSGTRHEFNELSGDPVVKVSAEDSGDNDWFDLGFEITIDGKQIPFAVLFAALAQGKSKLMLVDRTYFSLDHPAFDQLRELIAEAERMDEWKPEQPRINRFQVAFWEEFDQLADETVASEAWRHNVRALTDFDGLPEVAAPAGLHADLRPYQLTGFRWLTFLWQNRLGGILADDMGLGKTVQTLALIAHSREAERPLDVHWEDDGTMVVEAEVLSEAPAGAEGQGASAADPADVPAVTGSGAGTRGGPFLVVAPTSVVANWKLEAERFTPGLDVRVVDATTKKRKRPLAEEVAGADLVITSYAIARIDAHAFQGTTWDGLILDEAQFVKNRTSKVFQAVRDVGAPFRLAITGTPMENSLSDLWSLAAITAPGLFPSFPTFKQEYIQHIEHGKEGAGPRMERLRKRIRPFMLRRTKDLVAADLPEKQEQVASVELVPKHRKLYDQLLQRERKKVLGIFDQEQDMNRAKFIVFRSLTLLRMMALDPAIVDPEEYADVPSSKMDVLMEHLEEVLAEGHRTLVFSQFTSFLHRVGQKLTERGVPFAYLDGSTRDRARVIEEFKTGEAPVFLISLKAGGFGLTLTEADYVFLLDPWWNPAAEAQAIDRTHRIGQTRNVMVYRMVAEDTIEEKVLALQQRKAEIFDALMDEGQAFSQAFTADDLKGLFEN